MILYHFTSAAHLRGIDAHGLTVGDVPTDLRSNAGKVGVWLTSSPYPVGLGLKGSSVDKAEIRLSVLIPDDGPLARWSDWSQQHAKPETRRALEHADGDLSGLMEQTPQESSAVKWQVGVVTEYR